VERRLRSSPFTPVLRVLTGLLGAASFGTRVFAVFVTQNGTGTGVLLAFGGVLLVLALLGDRIESFEFGGATLRLRAAAAERFALGPVWSSAHECGAMLRSQSIAPHRCSPAS
jgi:hypothetical protein